MNESIRPREVTQAQAEDNIRHSNAASSAFAKWDKRLFHTFNLVAITVKPSLGVEYRGVREAVFVLVEDPRRHRHY
jgi:hypothetical protein